MEEKKEELEEVKEINEEVKEEVTSGEEAPAEEKKDEEVGA